MQIASIYSSAIDLLENNSLVGTVASLVAAIFAVLAYRLQLANLREKIKIVFSCGGRNWSHATIAITNKGPAVVVKNVRFVSGNRVLFSQNCHEFLKHGADTSFSEVRATFDAIPVDVENWIIVTLSDETELVSKPFVFRKKNDTAIEEWIFRFPAAN
jgi:hypothetical protein